MIFALHLYSHTMCITHTASSALYTQDGGGVGVGEQARGVVAVEMLSLLGNRIWDFPDCPTLTDVRHTWL